jgi:hypothetical protein
MRIDAARTISMVAIWAAVAGILMTLNMNGSSAMITESSSG